MKLLWHCKFVRLGLNCCLLAMVAVLNWPHLRAATNAMPVPLPGWRMELLASAPAIQHPSVVCTAPDGRIFVAEDPMDISSPHADVTEGSIQCLHPDGRITRFVTGLHAVFGMQYLEGRLYVLHNPQFSAFTDAGDHGTDRVELIAQTNPNPWALDWNDHVPANFRLGLDGFFYVATGDKGLYGATGTDGRRLDMRLGGIFRVRPDGTGLEKFSDGVRNILDVAMTSEDDLFTYDNTDEHDWMGRLTHMVDGGFYGYPFEFSPRQPHTLWMFADYGPGAATGAFAATDDALPAEFRDNLFLSDFGQRNVRRVVLARANGTFREARNEQLFINPPPDFRPVGIHETEDGRGLLICDWQHLDNKQVISVGRLWRLSLEAATNAAPRPRWYVPAALGKSNPATAAELTTALAHSARRVRILAQRELQRRNSTQSVSTTSQVNLLANPNSPALARIHALWSFAPAPGKSPDPITHRRVQDLLVDHEAIVVRQALRWLGELHSAAAVPSVARQLANREDSIRFAAATALGRIGDAGAVPPLLSALNSFHGAEFDGQPGTTNLWPRYACWTALNRIGRNHPEMWPQIVDGLATAATSAREAVRFALRETYDEKLAAALALAARDSTRPTAFREAALRLLAAVHRQPPPWTGDWWAYHPYRLQPPAHTVDWVGTPTVLATLRAVTAEVTRRGDGPGTSPLLLAAIEGLELVHDRESAGLLRDVATGSSNGICRVAALRALGELGDADALGIVVSLLERTDTPAEIRAAALGAAGKLAKAIQPPPAPLVSALLAALMSDTASERSRLDALDAIRQAKLTNAVTQLLAVARTTSPALRESAVPALAGLGVGPALAPLSELVREAPLATRRAAVTSLGSLRDKAALPLLLAAARQPELRLTAQAALTVLPAVEAVPAYLEALATSDVVLRDQARRALREVGEAALPVIEAGADKLSPGVRAELRRVYEGNSTALAKPFLTVTGDQTLSPDDYARHALATAGDAWRGQRIFFDETRVACIRCHAVHGWGGGVGPELTTAGAQFGRAALIEAILYPSKAVREGYQQVELELRGGDTLAGIAKAENATAVTILDATGQAREVRRAEIIRRSNSPRSLMPEGLHTVLSPDDFADLLAYLDSLKTDPRHVVAIPTPTSWTPLLNGRDLQGWHSVPDRDSEKNATRPPRHWTFHEGVLEHDGAADHVWTDRSFGDFTLRFDWRWMDAPKWEDFPIINSDGEEARGPAGVVVTERVLDAGDSGVFVRGLFAAQANLFCYPVGSGEFWELRTAARGDGKQAFTPRLRADRPLGQWNRTEVTVRGDTITVVVNGEEVVSSARIPGLPARGPIGFQHEHGKLQITGVFVREL
jgi:putative heme-binding domain-containing protein